MTTLIFDINLDFSKGFQTIWRLNIVKAHSPILSHYTDVHRFLPIVTHCKNEVKILFQCRSILKSGCPSASCSSAAALYW